jgi:hypothetical protein
MIIFHNPGLIPLDVFRLRGVSVKQAGAFGRFGTGLSYAIAAILRGGGSIRVWRGADELCFDTNTVWVKDQSFQEVTLIAEEREDPLGFTTLLGKDWEPWMALRELACNARDEGGDFKLTDMPAVPDCFSAKDDETVIVVEWPEMDEAAREDGARVFVPGGEPLLEESGVRVLPGPSDYLYHRGVRVWKLPRPSVFTYDVTSAVDLTEDRTVKYGFCVVSDVRNMILATSDRTIIAAAVSASNGTWESGFDWSGKEWAPRDPGQDWLEEVGHLRAIENGVNKSAIDVFLAHSAYKSATRYAGGSYEEPTGEFGEALSALEEIDQHLVEDLQKVNTFVAEELPGETLSTIRGGSIYVTKKLLEESRYVIARETLTRYLEIKSGGDHDVLLGLVVPLLLDQVYSLKREREQIEEAVERQQAWEAKEAARLIEEKKAEADTKGFTHTENTCPGHIASAWDSKVCGLCGVHINSLRPGELDDDLPF